MALVIRSGLRSTHEIDCRPTLKLARSTDASFKRHLKAFISDLQTALLLTAVQSVYLSVTFVNHA